MGIVSVLNHQGEILESLSQKKASVEGIEMDLVVAVVAVPILC